MIPQLYWKVTGTIKFLNLNGIYIHTKTKINFWVLFVTKNKKKIRESFF